MFTLVSIIGILDAENWYVPIIDGLRYILTGLLQGIFKTFEGKGFTEVQKTRYEKRRPQVEEELTGKKRKQEE